MLRSYRSRLVCLLPVALLVVTSAVVGDKLDDPCAISPESCPMVVRFAPYRVICPNTPLISTEDMDALPWENDEPPQRSLTLEITDPNGVVYHIDGFALLSGVCSSYRPFADPLPGGVPPGDGKYTIEVWARDEDGGSFLDPNTTPVSRTIYLSHDPNCCGPHCNTAPEPEHDCNGNGVNDDCDVNCGFSHDCNANGVPDECDIDNCPPGDPNCADCNGNWIPDGCDRASGRGFDCNHNEILDECDLTSRTSNDCNNNGIPDECDIASGTSSDCNHNGIPDDCEGGDVHVQIRPDKIACPNTPLLIETWDYDPQPWDANEPPRQWLTVAVTGPWGEPHDALVMEMAGGVCNAYRPTLLDLLGTTWARDGAYTIEVSADDEYGYGSCWDPNTAQASRLVYVSHDPNCCAASCNDVPQTDCDGDGIDDACEARCIIGRDCDRNGSPDGCEDKSGPVGVRITADKLVCPNTPILIETWDFDAKPWDPNEPPSQNLFIYITDPSGQECSTQASATGAVCNVSTITLSQLVQQCLTPCELCDGLYTIRAYVGDAGGGGGMPDSYDPNVSASCAVHMFRDPNFCTGECSGAPQEGKDCNGNGIDDSCEIRAGLASDFNDNKVPDDCDANTPSSGITDCDHNEWPDQYCPPVDLVILVDTSDSMFTEEPDGLLWAVIDGLIEELRDSNAAVYPEILAISPSYGTDNIAYEACTVPGRYGTVLKDGNNPTLRASPLETCHADSYPHTWQMDAENWGPACAVVAANKDVPGCGMRWHSNAVRVIVPISDSPPCCGCGIDDEDHWAIEDAIAIANTHQVTVCPIVGIDPGWLPDCHIMPDTEDPNDPNSVFVLASHLAGETGGHAYLLADPNVQYSLSAYIKGIVLTKCSVPADCDGDGIPNACEIENCPTGDPNCADCNHNGIPDKCDIDHCPVGDPSCADCNGNGVPDWCDIRDCPPGDPNCADDNHNGVPDSCDAPPIIPFVIVHNALSTTWDPNTATCTASANECDLLRIDASGTQGAPASGLLFEWDLTYTGDPNQDFKPSPDAYGPEFEYAWRSSGESESISIGLRISNGPTGTTKYANVQLTITDSTPLLLSLSGPSQIVVGQLGCFVASPAVRCDDVVSVTWDFGDGNQTSTQIPVDLEQRRAWSSAGVYGVSCRITDWDGDISNTQSLTVQVTSENPPYQARATELQVERQYHVYDPNFTEQSPSIRHSAELRVKNIGEYPVPGPIHVAFEGLTPAATVLAGGSTDPNLGAPHIQIAGAEVTLAPQQASEWTWVEWQVPIESTEPFDYAAVAYTLQLPPVFRTEPPPSVAEGELYTYEALAEDPEGEPVYYELVAPVPAGMRINSASGLLTWPVGHSAANSSPYPIKIRAHDPYTYTDQAFQLTVTAVNAPPFVKEVPQLTAAAGGSYESRIVVEDPEGGDANAQYTVPQGMVVAPDPNQANTWNLTWSPVTKPDFTLSFHFTDAGQPSGSNQQAIDANYLVVVTDCNYPHISRDPLNNLEQAVEGQPYLKQIHLVSGGPQGAYFFLDQAPAGMTINPTGLIQWLPPYTAAGTPVVRVRVSNDPAGESACFDTYAFNIQVANRNAAPVVTSCPDTQAREGELYTYQVTADDPDADPLDFRLLEGPAGMQINPVTGLLRWVPSQTAAPGPYRVRIQVRDPAGAAAEIPADCNAALDYHVTVEGVNVPPTFTSRPITYTPEDELYVYRLAATDADGDQLEFELLEGPDGMVLRKDGNDPRLEWLPPAPGVYAVRVGVSDGHVLVERPFPLTVYRAYQPNKPPTLVSFDPNAVAVVGVSYTAVLIAADLDREPNGMTFEFVDAPPAMGRVPLPISPADPNRQSWQIQWTPDPNDAGRWHDVTLRVLDKEDAGFFCTWSIYVFDTGTTNNHYPVILNDPNGVAEVNQPYLFALHVVDPDSDAVTFEKVPAPQGGPGGSPVAPPGGFDVDDSGNVTWTPTAEQVGLHWVAVKVTDEHGASVTLVWPIWVTDGPSDDTPPRITSKPVRWARPSAPYQYLVEFEDPDIGDSHTFSLTKQPPGATVHPATGLVQWTPTVDQLGQHEFFVRVTDAAGAWAEQQYYVAVTPNGDNEPPTITSTPPIDVGLGATYSYCLIVEDDQSSSLQYTVLQGPAGMGFVADPNCSARLTWEPNSASLGTHSVVVRATDAAGAWAQQEFSVTVWDGTLNRPPDITSTPQRLARVDEQWTYRVRVTDESLAGGLRFEALQRPAGTTVMVQAADPNDPNAMHVLLTWTPASSQIGVQAFVIRATDVHNAWREQRFDVVVSVDGLNHAPRIASTPRTTVRQGETYVYDVVAQDPDPGDRLSYSLRPVEDAAAGMRFDPVQPSRLILPTSADQNSIYYSPVAAYPVVVRVTDQAGAWVEQSFDIAVTDPNAVTLNHPPRFISPPPEQPANVGVEYTYILAGFDEDGDELTFATVNANLPDPNELDPPDRTRAKFVWTPQAGDAGRVPIKFALYDGKVTVYKTFEFLVLGPGGNYPPRITSTPVFNMKLGRPYSYQATAEDPESGVLTWQLAVAATHTGMLSINSATGLVTSTGTNQPPEPCTVDVAVFVADPQGSYAQQPYTIDVRANEAPRIVSSPVRQGVVNEQYRYAVIATDADSRMGELHYTLTWLGQGQAPTAQIDPNSGLINWTPTAAATYPFRVTVTDECGAQDDQDFAVRVVSEADVDLFAPTITITVDHEVVLEPNKVTITISVQDDRPVSGKHILLTMTKPDQSSDSNDLTLDPNGQARIEKWLTTVGIYGFVAEVTDSGNHTRTASVSVRSCTSDPNMGMTAYLVAPGHQVDNEGYAIGIEEVSGRYQVRGHVFGNTPGDPNAGFWKWTLGYFTAEEPDTQVEIACGYRPEPADANLAIFDTTLLPNGMYRLRLTAWNLAEAPAAFDDVDVVVTGEAKVGHFELTFTDLEVPVAGVPIRVLRTYDSRIKTARDFGQGWKLELSSLTAQESTDMGADWPLVPAGWNCSLAAYVPHVVSVTLPGQRTEYFRMEPLVYAQGADFTGCMDADVLFVSFARVSPGTSELGLVGSSPGMVTAANGLYDSGDENVLGWSDGSWNVTHWVPDGYRLTAADGTQYEFTRRVGRVLKLSKVIGLNGNTLEISDDQIVSNRIAVQIHRRADGRVTEVVDPEGNAITYGYDTPGRLTSVTDREKNTTTFRYDFTDTLVEIIDPRGVPVARNDYDADGRLVATTDAAGNKTKFEHVTLDTPDPNDGSVGYEKITDRNNTVTAHYYDAHGNVTREVHYSDPNGQNETCRTSHSYDPNYGNLLATTDALGRTAKNEYGDTNNPTKVTKETDFEGRVTEYTYNQNGQVTDVTRTGAGTTHSRYDANGNLEEVRDPGNGTTTYVYDAWGNVTTIRDALDNPSQMTYDERGRMATRTDALNKVTAYTYDDRRQWETRTRMVNGVPEEIVSFSETDLDGRTIRQVDPLGHQTTTTYTAGGQTETVTNVNGTTEYEYTVRGELATVYYPDDSTESYTYDAGGRRDLTTDRDGRRVKSVYDALGRLVRTVYIDPNTPDPNNCPTCPYTETVYDLIGRVQSRSDENRVETRYDYHDDLVAQGIHRQTVTNVDPNDPNNPAKSIATVYEYDDAGRLAKMTDNAGKVTRYEYDVAGRPWKTVFHDGTYTATTYDLLGRKKTQRDQARLVTEFGYDELGRLKKVIDALNHETNYAYDELGSMTSTVDAEQHETKLAYDKLGRLTTRTLPPVNGQSLSESFNYDAAGNLSTHQRFDGTQITYEHDLDGRVTKKVTSEQKTYFFHWSPGGRLETVGDDPCNPSDAYGSFAYDARGRLSLERREDGDKLVYAYDPGGNRTDAALAPRWEDPNKPTWKTHYEYDGLNRLKTVSEVLDPNGSATSKAIGEYFYDAVGNLDHVTLGNGTAVEYGYDNLHRLTSVKNYRDYGGAAETVISSFTYTLGDAGNRTAVVEQLSDRSRRTISYVYDDLYRLTQEWADTREPNGQIVHERQVDYVYDNVGNRKTMTVRETAGGVTATYTVTYEYDAHDRLKQETRSGTCLMAAVYTRDRAEYAVARTTQPLPARWAAPALLGFGLLTLVCTLLPLVLPRSGAYGRRWERRRLWTACVGLFFVPQFIVGASNLLGLHVEGLEAQALADASACNQTTTYIYDDGGNLHSRTVTVGTQVTERNLYVFNSEDRLAVFDPQFDPNAPAGQYSAGATHYTYDQDGVRTSRMTAGVTTYYIVDKNRDLPQVLEERNGTGALKVRYLYGHDLLAQVRPTTGGGQDYSYYHYDGQLSTRQLTDDNPVPAQVRVTNNYTYDAFGADLSHTGLPGNAIGAPENLYRYTGEQHDPATGFYYLRARYYDTGTGRFASRDPFGGFNSDPMTLHKYLYCGANPVGRVDPSGRFTVGEAITVVAIIAILAACLYAWHRYSLTGVRRPTGARNVLVRISIDPVNKPPTFNSAVVERKLTQLMQKNLNLGTALTIRIVDEQTAPPGLMWTRQPEAGFDQQFNDRVTWNIGRAGCVASTAKGETQENLAFLNQKLLQFSESSIHNDVMWSNNLAHEVFWVGLGSADETTERYISSKVQDVSAPTLDFRDWERKAIVRNLGLSE